MHIDQLPYRTLYDAVLEHGDADSGADLLGPWVVSNPQERVWLADFGGRGRHSVPAATPEERWRLYGLSRVLQLLLRERQEGDHEGAWAPRVGDAAYLAFVGALGLTVAFPVPFSPFDHEIVRVTPVEGTGHVRVRGHLWPRLMLGNLLVQRGGVHVEASPDVMVKQVAESSMLHWALRRRNRRSTDLSVGWGSNSQWRTSFRRDYRIDGVCYYNVDGTYDLGDPAPPVDENLRELHREDGLTCAERIELLCHRCLVTSHEADHDLWPWDDRLVAIHR